MNWVEEQLFGVPFTTILEWKREHEMNNELQIKPLLKYEVSFTRYGQPGGDEEITETFTAESYVLDAVNNTVRFMRTGNIIREYFQRPNKIVVTPADEG